MKTIKILMLLLLFSFASNAQELVSGKATLTKIKNEVFYIKVDSITKKIDLRPDFDKHIQGTLSVLFKDCEDVRLSVFKDQRLNEEKLISLVKEYNNCTYAPFQLTEKEAQRAADFQGDELRGFAKLGTSINRTSFFDGDNYENQVQGKLGIGMAATPGFLGSIQGNLYFTLEVEAAFSGDKDFDNSPLKTNFSKNTYQGNLGTEFHFNKNGSFQPLIGINVGLRQNYYKGNFDNYRIKNHVGSAFVMPKLGVLFSIDEKKSLGLILSYIPKSTDDLSFINEDDEVVPFLIDSYNLNAGVYLYF